MTEPTSGIGTLGIDLKIFLAQLVNFAVVLFVLWKWAYTPLLKLLDARSEKIEKSLKDADEVTKRVASLETERAAVIREAKAEAAKIVEAAQADAEARRVEMVEKSKREVERVVVNGKAALRSEQENMLREARKEMVEIAVAAAHKIFTEGVDEKKANSLAEEVVRKMT